MRISAKVGNRLHEVEIERQNGVYVIEIDGTRYEADTHKLEADFYSILAGGKSYEVAVEATRAGYLVRHGASEQLVTLTDPGRQAREAQAGGSGPETITSVMPGKVVRLLVAEGDEVEEGQGLVVVEAMKMENEIAAPRAGKITHVAVSPDQTVESGADLLTIE